MTEDEAKTRWCPAVRLRTLLQVSVRNGHAPDEGDTDCNCIASACMAWRWSRDDYEAPKKVWHTAYSATDGYCGLAGAPT